ncbi:hypothetical protein C8R44DRAFT_873738 [Mycena epipterygia]|nr:hypothetical protein C8R44DRAFT_873738 [Mycena epipterygia]
MAGCPTILCLPPLPPPFGLDPAPALQRAPRVCTRCAGFPSSTRARYASFAGIITAFPFPGLQPACNASRRPPAPVRPPLSHPRRASAASSQRLIQARPPSGRRSRPRPAPCSFRARSMLYVSLPASHMLYIIDGRISIHAAFPAPRCPCLPSLPAVPARRPRPPSSPAVLACRPRPPLPTAPSRPPVSFRSPPLHNAFCTSLQTAPYTLLAHH